jgi:RNA polymerase sigma-70 factor (ECF subfamily)
MDEARLIQDAQKGDLNAFNTLVLHYQDMAFQISYRLLSNPALAEDITQDAFIAAFRKIGTYRGGSFKAWLMRIVTNASYDELRRQKRRPTTPLEPENDEGEVIESAPWMEDPSETPEEAILRNELKAAIQYCLNNLPPEFKAVVVLVDIQGFDYSEAAEIVKTPLGTIKSRLARARIRLQECLKGFGELLPSIFRLEEERLQ